MPNDLYSRKVTGEVLVAYDEMIRAWVLDQLKDVGATINEDRVQEMIDAALDEFNGAGATTEQIKSIIQEMIDSGEISTGSEAQFRVISDKTFSTVDQIVEEFPVGESENVVLKNVTINFPDGSETFQNVLANVKNVPDGDESTRTVTIVTNDGRNIKLSYDSNDNPSTASPTKTSESDLSSLGDTVNNLSESITNINEIINNIQTNSITEERVQEMIDASVGAAISDSY